MSDNVPLQINISDLLVLHCLNVILLIETTYKCKSSEIAFDPVPVSTASLNLIDVSSNKKALTIRSGPSQPVNNVTHCRSLCWLS